MWDPADGAPRVVGLACGSSHSVVLLQSERQGAYTASTAHLCTHRLGWAAACSLLPPHRQRAVLRAWEIAIDKTGGYIYSRALLALISAVAHYIALAGLGVPYAVTLALWVGVVSQFIPAVGTYLAGAVPVLIALTRSPSTALWTLLF